MTPDSIIVDDVLVVRCADRGWLCEIHGRPTFVERTQLSPGSRMPSEGQRGTMRLTVAAATALGLIRRRTA
jgi:hypothetical protein